MNRVSMLRKEAGLSQKELAARLGVQPSVVSKYENGGIQLQEDTLRQLVIIFDGVSADFILGLSDDRKRGTSRATPQIVWDAVALVEGADTLSEENRTLLLDCIKDPEILALAGRFQRLSKKSKRRVVEYMDLLRLADEQAKTERQESQPPEEKKKRPGWRPGRSCKGGWLRACL